ncbi:MAG: tetratricopeptide repeat protein [Geminicoccaceae bacterium]
MPRVAALAVAVMLTGLSACSSGSVGSYESQIPGSYGSSYKRGYEAARAKDFSRAAEHHAFAAKSGHPRALLAYGRLFAKGQGVERDPARAVALFQEAYDKRSDVKAKAAMALGQAYLTGGDGPSGTVDKDEASARELLDEALDGGEYKAAAILGKMYDRGLGVERDQAKAIAYYRQAATSDANAALRLATLLVDAGASKEDVAATAKNAVGKLEARGEAGDGRVWMKLADIYSNDRIVDADPARASAYLQKLPEDGDPAMNLRLARIYGQIGDFGERRKRLRLSADAGDAAAQAALAKVFLQPGTPDTNGAVGRYYAELAVGQGNKAAMIHLGLALVRGNVLEREPLLGETLLRRASEDGHAGATTALGASILSGNVRALRPAEGRELLETAAEQGSTAAMSALGFAYHLGKGLPKDEPLSVEWLQKAADAGDRGAREFLTRRQGV